MTRWKRDEGWIVDMSAADSYSRPVGQVAAERLDPGKPFDFLVEADVEIRR